MHCLKRQDRIHSFGIAFERSRWLIILMRTAHRMIAVFTRRLSPPYGYTISHVVSRSKRTTREEEYSRTRRLWITGHQSRESPASRRESATAPEAANPPPSSPCSFSSLHILPSFTISTFLEIFFSLFVSVFAHFNVKPRRLSSFFIVIPRKFANYDNGGVFLGEVFCSRCYLKAASWESRTESRELKAKSLELPWRRGVTVSSPFIASSRMADRLRRMANGRSWRRAVSLSLILNAR